MGKSLPSGQKMFNKYASTLTREMRRTLTDQKKDFIKAASPISNAKRPLVIDKFDNKPTLMRMIIEIHEKNKSVQLWRWLFITGTEPHEITARRAPLLRFRLGYSPKMRGGTGVAKGLKIRTKSVYHLGFEPVKTVKEIVKKYKNERLNIIRKHGIIGLRNAKR